VAAGDSGWSLRVTRRIQELSLQTSKAIPVLTQLRGRTPTVSDLALYLHLSEKDTRDGLHGLLAYQTWSLNMPAGDNQDVELGQLLGGLDAHLEAVPDRYALAQYVAGLSARDRAMLYLRFVGDLSQREIGEQLGLSQMHVSRLLSGCSDRSRELMLAQN
jgi:RNA polymerase sigma-B factor